MSFVELAGWITVGLILLSQVIQQITAAHRFHIQAEDMRVILQQQNQVTDNIKLLDINIQQLQADLCQHAIMSQSLASEIRTLGIEVGNLQVMMTKNITGH